MYHRISGRDSCKIGIVKPSYLGGSNQCLNRQLNSDFIKGVPHECEHFRDYLNLTVYALSSEVVKGRLESTEWDLW
ncbi:vitamin K epoxide reductase complex, subunit 1-like 1, isoform CRA_b [Rattus norvegicus]|uniref:Vitamin K epoxide reductase complex, subunit 1-like 1, isoform CRA_b n=1 Tax=Rattus norvegicus TaxID=10116 RepID=A6J0N9_RAT|nr:vitamin K epoxide reductase complex, subunit 1-like 1, isoform CRA_b [Rattus norvegicus]